MVSIRVLAGVFGLILLAVGIAGFIPTLTWDGHLLGIFMVDTMHNFVHIATGIVAFLVCLNAVYSLWFFRIIGFVYFIIGILGFYEPNLMGMTMNFADNALHVGIGLVSLYLGFLYHRSMA